MAEEFTVVITALNSMLCDWLRGIHALVPMKLEINRLMIAKTRRTWIHSIFAAAPEKSDGRALNGLGLYSVNTTTWPSPTLTLHERKSTETRLI